MTIISPDEYDLLMSLSGHEQNLQAGNIGKKYGLSVRYKFCPCCQDIRGPQVPPIRQLMSISQVRIDIVSNMIRVPTHHNDAIMSVKPSPALVVLLN